MRFALIAVVIAALIANLGARLAIDSAFASGLFFELGGALLAVLVTVVLVEELLKVQHREKYKARREQALRSLCRELEASALAFIETLPAELRTRYQQTLSSLLSPEDFGPVLKHITADVLEQGEAPEGRSALHSTIEPRLQRITDYLADRLLDTGEDEALTKSLSRLDGAFRHWGLVVQGDPDDDSLWPRARECLLYIEATHATALKGLLSNRRIELSADVGANDWDIRWASASPPLDLPAAWVFVFNRAERRIVAFERGDPWPGHYDAFDELGWWPSTTDGGQVGVGIVIDDRIDYAPSLPVDGRTQLDAYIHQQSRRV